MPPNGLVDMHSGTRTGRNLPARNAKKSQSSNKSWPHGKTNSICFTNKNPATLELTRTMNDAERLAIERIQEALKLIRQNEGKECFRFAFDQALIILTRIKYGDGTGQVVGLNRQKPKR